MNYFKYRKTDKYITESSLTPLEPDEHYDVCFGYTEIDELYNYYILELNENNELIATIRYLKEV